jgi:hypothetical protein
MVDIDKITESTASRATARIAAVLMVPLIGLLGWFAIDLLTGIKENQKLFWQQIGGMNTKFGEIKDALGKIDTGLSVATTNYIAHVKDDDHFDATIEKTLTDHDVRLRLIEQRPAALMPVTPVAPPTPTPAPAH